MGTAVTMTQVRRASVSVPETKGLLVRGYVENEGPIREGASGGARRGLRLGKSGWTGGMLRGSGRVDLVHWLAERGWGRKSPQPPGEGLWE